MRIRRPSIKNFNDSYIGMYGRTKGWDNSIGDAVTSITFIVTKDCNLNCSYCYQHNKNKDSVMSLDIAKRTVDFLFEEDIKKVYIGINPMSAITLDFIGGEPLLEIDLIDKIIEYFLKRALELNHRWAIGHMISISTNGILYENPKVQRFLDKYDGKVSMSISIDGNKDLHDACRKFPDGRGSYDIVESAYKVYLSRTGFKATKLTVAPENVKHLFSACIHLYNMGLQDISANCVYEEGWNLGHASRLYHQLKEIADYLLEDERYLEFSNSFFEEKIGIRKDPSDNQNWCGGTGKMLAIDDKGNVYPCLRYAEYCLGDSVRPIVIGNIWDGIESTQEQKEQVKCLKCITRRSQSTDECFDCPVADGCAWCSAYNYELNGTPNSRATFICVMHKARVLANVYFFNNLYRLNKMKDRFPLNLPEEEALKIIPREEFNNLLLLAFED